MKTWRGLLAWLEAPRTAWVAVALGVALTLGSLGNGLVLDDVYHRQILVEGEGYLDQPRASWDLFRFFPDDAGFRDEARRTGLWPWWMGETTIAFFRPVSSLTHALDYRLWPNAVWLMHLHSVAWYGALLAMAVLTYRRLVGSPLVVALASLLFAVDAGHAIVVGWLATRNMLVAAVFAFAALLAHDVHRRGGKRIGAWLSPLSLLVALCSGEVALGIVGYLVAYALFLDPAARSARFLALVPHLLVVGGWQLAYRALGYGTHGSGLYVHPLESPAAFAEAAATRWPVLVATQLTLPFADVWAILPSWGDLALAAAALALLLALLAHSFAPLLRQDPRARMLALGGLLAALPLCATLPNTRLLLLVGFGGFGLIALFVERQLEGGAARARRIVAGALIARHLALAPIMLLLGVSVPRAVGGIFDRADASLPDDAALAEQTLVVVNAPHVFLVSFLPISRRAEARPRPQRLRLLGTTLGEVRIFRAGPRSLLVETPSGYLEGRPHHLTWGPSDRHEVGHRVVLEDVTVVVERVTPDGRPEAVRFDFTEPLEHARHRWVIWSDDRFGPFPLPAVGERVVVPPLALRRVLTGS